MEPELYTVSETAKILKCNIDYVHKLRKAGVLQFMKLGTYKIRKEELNRFLEEAQGFDYSDPNNPVRLQ